MASPSLALGKVTMMEPGVKIAAASSVLLGGIFVALLFRHDAPRATPPAPEAADRLVLGQQPQPPEVGGPARDLGHSRGGSPPSSASAAGGAAGQKATILKPLDSGEPPPALARDYPGADEPDTSGWGMTIDLPPPASRPYAARTHKIVDGDTLGALAERYLGSKDRRLEIYEANRNVLPSPELLPIGVVLKIPPLRRAGPPFFGLLPHRPMPPISRPPVARKN
jgi:nucleoid-associated protein YgaU